MTSISSDISSLISQYDEIIWKTISKLDNGLDLDIEFMYDVIIQRLPDYLRKQNMQETEDLLFLQTWIVRATQRIYSDVVDVILVRRQSPELIVKYIPLISQKVQYFTNTSYIKASDADDVLQIVQEKLLGKLSKGQLAAYKESEGNLFSTFLFKVIDNLIKDIAKSLYQTQKNQSHLEISEPLIHHESTETNVLSSLIQDEQQSFLLQQLKYHMLTYSLHIQQKLEICLKVNTRLILSIEDAALLQLNIHQSKQFVRVFGQNYVSFSLGELWKAIQPFLNIFEQKESSSDNHRKWYVRLRNQLVVKLLLSSLLKQNPDLDQGGILQKISSERTIAKLAEEWLYELVEIFYQKKS